MQARLLLAAGMVLMPLSGCTGSGDERPGAPMSRAPVTEPSAPEPKQPAYVGRASPLVQNLWRPVGDLPALRTVLPGSLRFDEIRQAPSLHEAPIGSAVLAVGTEPQAYSVGEVAVVSPGGEWRVIDRVSLGMRNAEIVEQQFKLSPDGRLLALGDEYGVVIVELATGTGIRIEVPSKDPVLHWWTPDGTSIVMTPRGAAQRTLAVRVADRVVERLGYQAWASSPGPGNRVAELTPNSRSAEQDFLTSDGAFTAVELWRDDHGTSDVVRLENAVPNDAVVGRQWSSTIGVVQGAYPEGRRFARGVLAIDSTTGRSLGLLALTPDQITWTSVAGALDDRWLLLRLPFGPGGGLVAWDPLTSQLRGVLAIDEQAANVSLAMQLVADSLR